MEVGPTTTSAKCNRIIHQPGSSAVGLNLKDTDNLSPSTPKDSYRTRQSKKNSSRCSIFGINGKIDPLSDSDDFDEEVIYSQESKKNIYMIVCFKTLILNQIQLLHQPHHIHLEDRSSR